MAFINGLILIDAPASALNLSQAEGITSVVKKIPLSERLAYPYVSAQAYKLWTRNTLVDLFPNDWQTSAVTRHGDKEKQQAYTEGNPIKYPDDDLFGYMRSIEDEDGKQKRAKSKSSDSEGETEKKEKVKKTTYTRIAPFRISTIVSIAPVPIIDDFGTMARGMESEKDNPVLHRHEFYRATLQGLLSINLSAAGTFITSPSVGYKNLDKAMLEEATNRELEEVEKNKTRTIYRLPIEERIYRLQMLLHALGKVEGGAKQALHYTDVAPAFVILAVTRGGNNIFSHLIKPSDFQGQPEINVKALEQIKQVFTRENGELISDFYVGRIEGFMDKSSHILPSVHPRQAFDQLAEDLAKEENRDWLK
ncbi:MAG: type I-B CRISPR-associated protein Cas7/Cst2/DevR [bacterium]|nr:type I-B CRISPR-associated protein Cas7/Cst2/DevR [bacterium]